MDELKKEILNQDNRSTSYVIFIIVEDQKVYGVNSVWQEDRERKDIDNIDCVNDLCESCTDKYDKDGDFPDDCDDCDDSSFISFRVEKDVPNLYAGFFFTAKAAEEHLEQNRHHYNSTAKTYGISAYHNEELKAVMRYIVGEENIKFLK